MYYVCNNIVKSPLTINNGTKKVMDNQIRWIKKKNHFIIHSYNIYVK